MSQPDRITAGVRVVQLLAVAPGDADTVPSHLGSIYGAWLGSRRSDLGPAVREDLDRVESTLHQLLGVRLAVLSRGLDELDASGRSQD